MIVVKEDIDLVLGIVGVEVVHGRKTGKGLDLARPAKITDPDEGSHLYIGMFHHQDLNI